MIHFQKKYPIRYAFSMIELIFVIVILGVVASIGSSIIAHVYDSYITQRSIHSASIKTELAINQLANRLTYRIDRSMLARKQGTTGYVETTDVLRIQDSALLNLNNMSLEWINYDNDSFSSVTPPLWSGFADLEASNYNTIVTPGSTLTQLQTLLNNTRDNNARPALLFLGENSYSTASSYDALCMYTSTNLCISPFSLPLASDTSITLTNEGNRTLGQMYYTEMYQIVSSAYAVIVTPAVQTDGSSTINNIPVWNLELYYNYQPWKGDIYTNGSHSTLLKNVSVFRFKHELNSIRLKLCVIEQLSATTQISICKEKAVIR